MFENITAASPDPILGLTDLFIMDQRPEKINLGIGVYTDETGQTPVLACVKKAEHYLLENEASKNYLSIEGLADFARHTQTLLFGIESEIITSKRARTAQTTGGTGALRVAADFLASQFGSKRIWISDPSWPNHKNIFESAGHDVCQYTYYDAATHTLDFDGMLNSLRQAQSGDIVLFHGCCHNPTGTDPDKEQWRQLAELSQSRGLIPLFDFAYQGFARGLEEDAEGLRIFSSNHDEMLIASSFSKNFGLYNERVGSLTLIAPDAKIADTAFSQIKQTIRITWSNPPAHGATTVATILGNEALYALWIRELTDMRQRIQRMRQFFVNTLAEKKASRDFTFITRQNGMFSFSGLTKEQVTCLREDFAVYAVNSGRINIAGMTPDNMSSLCEAITAVL